MASLEQPQPLVEAEGDVEVLHGLTGCAFQQVVETGHDNQATRRGIEFPADVAEVRVRDVFDLPARPRRAAG